MVYQTILFKHPHNEPTVCPHNDGSLLRSTFKASSDSAPKFSGYK